MKRFERTVALLIVAGFYWAVGSSLIEHHQKNPHHSVIYHRVTR